MGGRGWLTGTLCLMVTLCASNAEAHPGADKRLKPLPVAATKFYTLPLPGLRANAPVWMGSQGKVAFLANQEAGGLVDVEVWDPVTKRLGRTTDIPRIRHSLVSAPDGRLAYVERDETATVAAPDPACQAGVDRIVVYDFQHGTHKTIFEGGSVLPNSLAWSRDGSRVAFLCNDTEGTPRLALLESGKPLVVTHMPVPYHLRAIAGWIGDHEVLAEATAPNGPEVLLRVGTTIAALPPGLAPKLSSDGRLLLTKASPAMGVLLRGAAGGGHTLNQTATSYAWGAKETVYVAVSPDVLALDLKGHVTKRYPGAAASGLDDMVVSPDGRYMALLSGHALAVMPL